MWHEGMWHEGVSLALHLISSPVCSRRAFSSASACSRCACASAWRSRSSTSRLQGTAACIYRARCTVYGVHGAWCMVQRAACSVQQLLRGTPAQLGAASHRALLHLPPHPILHVTCHGLGLLEGALVRLHPGHLLRLAPQLLLRPPPRLLRLPPSVALHLLGIAPLRLPPLSVGHLGRLQLLG